MAYEPPRKNRNIEYGEDRRAQRGQHNSPVCHEILDGYGLGQALERRYLVNRSQMGVSPGGGDIAML
jgi:hypothetical protein